MQGCRSARSGEPLAANGGICLWFGLCPRAGDYPKLDYPKLDCPKLDYLKLDDPKLDFPIECGLPVLAAHRRCEMPAGRR